MDHHRPPRAGKFKFGGNVGKVDLVLQRRLQTNLPFQLYSATVLVTPSNATLTPGQYHKCTTCIINEPLCTAACATIVPPVLVPPAVEAGSSTPPHLLQRPLVTCVLCIHYHRHISSPLSHHRHHYPTATMASVRMTFHHH